MFEPAVNLWQNPRNIAVPQSRFAPFLPFLKPIKLWVVWSQCNLSFWLIKTVINRIFVWNCWVQSLVVIVYLKSRLYEYLHERCLLNGDLDGVLTPRFQDLVVLRILYSAWYLKQLYIKHIAYHRWSEQTQNAKFCVWTNLNRHYAFH